MTEQLVIAGRTIGRGHPAFLVADVAQAHDGSLGMAHAYIDVIADAGADAVKFQTHIAACESTLDEPFRVAFSRQDATRYDYWRRMEFTEEQWQGLAAHAADRGLVFLSSPFSAEAVGMLDRIGVPAWKLGSGEYRSLELLDALAPTGKPVLLSTGMSRWAEIEQMAGAVRQRGLPLAVFQCVSRYPAAIEDAGLNVIDELRRRFGCPIGLSDHSGTVFPGLAAMARGADLLEVHVTFDRRLFGPDVPASVTLDELRLLADAARAFHVMETHPLDKDAVAATLESTRALFTKSVAPAAVLPAGTVLTMEMLVSRKPGSGIPFARREELVGRRLRREVHPDRLLTWEDVDVRA